MTATMTSLPCDRDDSDEPALDPGWGHSVQVQVFLGDRSQFGVKRRRSAGNGAPYTDISLAESKHGPAVELCIPDSRMPEFLAAIKAAFDRNPAGTRRSGA